MSQAKQRIIDAAARAARWRKPLMVSEWADANFYLSSKGSAHAGKWRTSRNPPLREPLDTMSTGSRARHVTLMFPIQFGKTEVARIAVGYGMDYRPGPIMVCLPGEVSRDKWVSQKLQPMIDSVPAIKAVLTSTASRDGANRREFKDFLGGQLYLEHAGSPARLKSTTVRDLIVDEVDEFANNTLGGDDPLAMLEGRTTAFPSTSRHLYISTPQVQGVSRIEYLWNQSDKRRYHLPCPHCGHEQHLQWSGLSWTLDDEGEVADVWYTCAENGCVIREHQKGAMIAAGQWVAEHPKRKRRGYHINCLYYQVGLGPRWADLVLEWVAAQGDPAKIKTFTNDRLAEPWEDPTMRAVMNNALADRAEIYPLRQAIEGVLSITAGVDTQDNRLACHIVGWGRGMKAWSLDYFELLGDPANDEVWASLAAILNQPIPCEDGGFLKVEAVAVDAGGHRTEAVKAFCRSRKVPRPMCIFGAKPANAPILSKGKLQDVNWRGVMDKRGVVIYHVGTVAAKHWLFSRLSVDSASEPEKRHIHFSEELGPDFFAGMVSETYNPSKNRFEKRRGGARNEPLDTWVYAYAATYHPELRLHRRSGQDWDRVKTVAQSRPAVSQPKPAPKIPAKPTFQRRW